jgi:hypothetical protein
MQSKLTVDKVLEARVMQSAQFIRADKQFPEILYKLAVPAKVFFFDFRGDLRESRFCLEYILVNPFFFSVEEKPVENIPEYNRMRTR